MNRLSLSRLRASHAGVINLSHLFSDAPRILLLACSALVGCVAGFSASSCCRSLSGSRHCSSSGLQGQQQLPHPRPRLGCLPSPVIIRPHQAIPTRPEALESTSTIGGVVVVVGGVCVWSDRYRGD